MADGPHYRDTRTPFVVADQAGITLTTTHKALWSPTLTLLPANYWWVGKTIKLTAYLKITTGTAGNYTYAMAYGAGDNPTPKVQSSARAYVASVGPFGAFMQGYATCRSIGTAGTLAMWGMVYTDLAAQLSTAQPNVFPNDGVTVVSTVDTTVATNALTFQMIASAGTHTVVTTNLLMEALN